MDKFKAKELEQKLKGATFNGYEVLELINNGKSAAVFKVRKENDFFALKIFDNELIERFGHEIQTKRIEQEIALKNHTIDNLVKIYDGGNTELDNQKFYFIVMELISGVNLKDYIESRTYEQSFILKVLEKLSTTTEQLLNQSKIAHRDIKPENIMVDNDDNIILMDMGVLKLVGAKSFSDEEEKSFVGTLRYAAPEFLLRTEEDSIQGWRAVNLYQIGATLHDLIMKKELFSDKIPYTNLVIAIKEDIPKISNQDVSFELLQLTRDMMTKDWKKRLELVTQDRLFKISSLNDNPQSAFDQSIEEIRKMSFEHQAKFDEIEKLHSTQAEKEKKRNKIATNLSKEFDKCFETIKGKGVFLELKKSENFYFNGDTASRNTLTQNYLYEINGGLKMGFPRSLYVLARMSNDDSSYAEIKILGIFPAMFIKSKVNSPLSLFQELYNERTPFQINQTYNNRNVNVPVPKTISIFEGIVDFDDSFTNHLNAQIIGLIMKALQRVKKNVQEELQWREDIAKSNQTFNTRVVSGQQTIIIDRL